MKNIIFFSNWTQGDESSGGDRIWIEFAKVWKKSTRLLVVCSEEAVHIAKRYGLEGVPFRLSSERIAAQNNLSVLQLIKNTCARISQGIDFFKRDPQLINETSAIYSCSDFWADSIPAFYVKKKNPSIMWIAGFYLFAPKPWQNDSPYKGINFLKGALFCITQLPVYCMVKKYADYVFVTSEPDAVRFVTSKRDRSKIIVVKGGVDLNNSRRYVDSPESLSGTKEFDACFVGRFHYQKGIFLLIDIWNRVVNKKPDAKLALIGAGPLETDVRKRIRQRNLEKNVCMPGFLDGEPKFEIFRKSRVVVHPATYDSGGMAAAEAMAWGLPGISFDLEALKTYYPKGMLKTPCFNLDAFAENILKLLDDKALYLQLRQEAISLASEWDWKLRASVVLDSIKSGDFNE